MTGVRVTRARVTRARVTGARVTGARASRWLALLVPVLLPLVPPAPAAAQDRAPEVVVVGVAGLRWDDVGPRTPVLARLADQGAVGALSVKGLPQVTCRGDGWLTLGAGARAQAGPDRSVDACTADLPTDLAAERRRNLASRDGAVIGALASQAQVHIDGPGALLAAAGAGRRSGPVRMVDAGTIATSADLPQVDAAVGRAVADLAPGTDLLVVGLSERVGAEQAHLHVAIALGPSFERGALRSASTRRSGYVQLVDVAPTVLALLGQDAPPEMDGEPWQVTGPAPDLAALVDLDRQARGQREAAVPFFVMLLASTLVVGAAASWRRRWAVAEVAALSGLAALGASFVANLVPWWRASVPLLGLLAVVAPLAVLFALVARAAARRAGGGAAVPAALVSAVVAGVVVVDLVTGARLQLGSVAGYSPLVAGRFAGIGNVAFGVLAAAALLATAVLARGALPIAAVGLAVVVVDGAPQWGSDVGGVLALVPAFALLAMLRTGTRVSVLRLLAAGAVGAGVVTAFAVADLQRAAADRTHLGRFAQDVVDGTAGDLLSRKAQSVLDLLLTSPLTALLPVVVAAVVALVVRPPAPLTRAFTAAPAFRHGLLAVGLASLIGFAVNDSGTGVVALALCLVLPATAAVVVGVHDRASRAVFGSAPL